MEALLQPSTLARSIALVLVGAAAATIGFVVARSSEARDVVIAADQFAALTTRLARLEEALHASSSSREGGPPQAPARVVETLRPEDPDPVTRSLLDEIAGSLRELVASQKIVFEADQSGIAKKPESLAKALEADAFDARRLVQRHFCWTPSQLYSTYGMPDSVGMDATGCRSWSYRIDGAGGWIGFSFLDGIITNVTLPKPSNR